MPGWFSSFTELAGMFVFAVLAESGPAAVLAEALIFAVYAYTGSPTAFT